MCPKKQARPSGLTCFFLVELPGIEPILGCWPLSRTGTELRNDIDCDSTELTSVDIKCAQNVPSDSVDCQRACDVSARKTLMRDISCN